MSDRNKNDDIRIKHHKRHVVIWRLLTFIFRPGLKLFFRLKSQVFKGDENKNIPESFMVISNHCTSYDPVMISLSFPQHMYFIAGNHVFKSGIWSRLLTWFFAPIGRQKSHSATPAVIESIKCLKQGYNVCMFAEGNCSYNGLTSPIPAATGKMLKKAGCGLVTYRFEGDYFMAPRWSLHRRWGPVNGHPVTYITANELKDMSADEINDIITRDLSEDAYQRQKENHDKYYGRKRAEALETLLYVCPSCHRISTMTSHKSMMTCDCGLKVFYDVYGFLHDESIGRSDITITEWDNFQRDYLFQLIEKTADGEIIFSDEDITLYKSNSASERISIMTGTLSISNRELIISERHFPMDQIIGFTTCNRSGLIFMYEKVLYELRAPHNFNALKYFDYYNYIMKKQGKDVWDRCF